MVTIEGPFITAAVSVRAVDSRYASCTVPHVCYIMQIVFESKKIRPMPNYTENWDAQSKLSRAVWQQSPE